MVNANEQFAQFIELKDIIVKSNGRVILDIPHALIPADRICACIGPMLRFSLSATFANVPPRSAL